LFEHFPLEHFPPLQSESDPQLPHWPLEHFPAAQSESEPQLLHFPLEHLLCFLQSESDPQFPHFPLEHLPTLQSESEPQAHDVEAGSSTASGNTTERTAARRFMGAPWKERDGAPFYQPASTVGALLAGCRAPC
jgi:hypothetical protein